MHLFHLRPDSIYNGLAVEELFFESQMTDLFLVWRSSPSVVIGKYQNIFNEVNFAYAESNQIDIARRSSGGGTVYHDSGNINFTFISNLGSSFFGTAARLLVDILRELSIEVTLNERLSLHCQGVKVSGSAQRLRRERAMYHATLLYDSNLSMLDQVITPDCSERETSASFSVASVRETVGNLRSIYKRDENTDLFLDRMTSHIEKSLSGRFRPVSDILQYSEIMDRVGVLRTKDWIYEAKR